MAATHLVTTDDEAVDFVGAAPIIGETTFNCPDIRQTSLHAWGSPRARPANRRALLDWQDTLAGS